MWDVFISYMREDAGEVGDLARQLRQRQIEVWIDEPDLPELGFDSGEFAGGSTHVGRDWQHSEHQALATASCIVGFWSKHAITERPREFRAEAAIGMERSCYIPVLLDNADPTKFGQPFNRLHFTRIWNRDDAFVSVLAAIRSHMHRARIERRKNRTLTREQASYWLDRREQIERIWRAMTALGGQENAGATPIFRFNHTDQDSVDLFVQRLIHRERLHLVGAPPRDQKSNPGADAIHLHLSELAFARDTASFDEALARWLLLRLEDHDRVHSTQQGSFERLRNLLLSRHRTPGPAEIIVARADFADPLFASERVTWLTNAWARLSEGLAVGSLLLFIAARHGNWLSRMASTRQQPRLSDPISSAANVVDLGWLPTIDAFEARHWQGALIDEWGVLERDRLSRDINAALGTLLGARVPMARFLERIQFPLTCPRRT